MIQNVKTLAISQSPHATNAVWIIYMSKDTQTTETLVVRTINILKLTYICRILTSFCLVLVLL